jgi:hypothetical protein
LLADILDPQRADEPFGAPFDETLHVLPTDQRDVLAEFLAIEIEQRLPMLRFLRLHLLEHLGGSWVRLAKPIGKITVNAPIFFLEKYRQRQNFALSEIFETLLGHRGCPRGTLNHGSVAAFSAIWQADI